MSNNNVICKYRIQVNKILRKHLQLRGKNNGYIKTVK